MKNILSETFVQIVPLSWNNFTYLEERAKDNLAPFPSRGEGKKSGNQSPGVSGKGLSPNENGAVNKSGQEAFGTSFVILSYLVHF